MDMLVFTILDLWPVVDLNLTGMSSVSNFLIIFKIYTEKLKNNILKNVPIT